MDGILVLSFLAVHVTWSERQFKRHGQHALLRSTKDELICAE